MIQREVQNELATSLLKSEFTEGSTVTVDHDGTNYVFGFAKLEDRLLILLDPDELLDPDKLEQVRGSQLSLVDQGGADS